MRHTSVRNTITEYISQIERHGLTYDTSFFIDINKKELKKKADTIFTRFLESCDYADESIKTKGMGEMLRVSFRDTICEMKRKSGEEYRILNDYFAFLQDHYRVKIDYFDRQLTPLERQLSIAKDLHDFNQAKEFDRHTVAEKYLVSDRTIESDMAALHNGISVMDQKLVLDDFRLKNKKVAAVSTMHPLFLTQNLTQVICMLEGLHKIEENWVMKSYARKTAVSIWLQLSEYARDRILSVLIDRMDLDRNWYEHINKDAESQSGQMFYNEKKASDRDGLFLYALKGDLKCSVNYITSDEKLEEIYGKVTRVDQNGIELLPDTGCNAIRIEKDRIIEVEVATELR